MKALLIPVGVVALLSGCVGYVDPGYGSYGYGQPAVSGYISSGPAYGPSYGPAYGPAYGGGGRRGGDRDRDGVPNRYDRDRDGDGVPNRLDSNPNNPRRN